MSTLSAGLFIASSSSSGEHLFDKSEPDRTEHLALDDLVARWHSSEFVRFVAPSKITSVNFDRSVVAAGGRAALEVGCLFVADGSPLEVEVKDENGRTLARLDRTSSGAPLRVTQSRARVAIPAQVTKEVPGTQLRAEAVLPEHGLRRPSSAVLRVGPRVVVRRVRFLQPGERREVERVRAGQTVRIQAELEASPRGALPEGTLALFRLFSMDPDDERRADEPLGAPLRARVKGPPGGRGAEVLWRPTVEQVAMAGDARAAREALGSQRRFEAEAERHGGPAGQYAPPRVFCQVEVWGALGTSLDPRGSGALEVRDYFCLQSRGLAGERYEIELPDGEMRRGTLDAQGNVEDPDVPPGIGHFRFPNTDIMC